jgi:alanyl-tRNA synthetase
VSQAQPGDLVEVILPETCFYIEAGGQVSDTGRIISQTVPAALPSGQVGWEIHVTDMRKPAAGAVIHVGEVLRGTPKIGDHAIASVDAQRRRDIMRNHTATHLLHAELRAILGEHARQAGSLVAPDRLRFDFTHPDAVTPEQLSQIEAGVNRQILGSFALQIKFKPLQQAIQEGAMALFGEKYSETVRTITIGDHEPFSYELCGGTHVEETGDIGLFLILNEGSVAANTRRIEAVSGRGAYELVQRRFNALKQTADLLATTPDQVPAKTHSILEELNASRRQVASLRQSLVATEFDRMLEKTNTIAGVQMLSIVLPNANADTLRLMVDRFRQRYPKASLVVLASVNEGRPLLIAGISDDLVQHGLHAGELVKHLATPLGGSGGGKPNLAQAGGKDASRLADSLASTADWLRSKLQS